MRVGRRRDSEPPPAAEPPPAQDGGAIVVPHPGDVLRGVVTVAVSPADGGAVEVEFTGDDGEWAAAPPPGETFDVMAGGSQVAVVRTRIHAEIVASALEESVGPAVVVPSGRAAAWPGYESLVLLDTTRVGDGRRRLRAVTHASNGSRFVSPEVEVVVDNEPPRLAVTDPPAGMSFLPGMRLAATAEDPGSGVAWLRFEWSRDGTLWEEIATLHAEPWETAWEHDLPAGPCLLRAVAEDGSGLPTASLRVQIALERPAGAPPPAPRPPAGTPAPPPAPAPPPPPEPVVAAPGARARWSLFDLERAVALRGEADPDRAEECRAMLFLLRDYAGVDGSLPAEFDQSVAKLFGPFLV